METLEQRIARVVQEDVLVVPYDPTWPGLFRQEKEHLLSCLPADLIRRIEHFGSTAVPGLSAKPIVDMLVEVTSLDETKRRVVPILESQGYDYFWRPTWGDDVPPWYAWFIKRDSKGARTHHIHMVERRVRNIGTGFSSETTSSSTRKRHQSTKPSRFVWQTLICMTAWRIRRPKQSSLSE